MNSGKGQKETVLVVDDDGDVRLALEMLLQYEGWEVWTAKDGREALARLDSEPHAPSLVITDLKMPRMDGLELLEKIRERDDAPPVVMVSGHGDVGTAVEAVKRGAADFLEKPLDENRVTVTLRGALRQNKLREENTGLRKQLDQRWELVGESAPMRALKERIEQVADSDAAVLLTGENGTGKEVVARNLHLAGPRAAGPFVTVNCAAIPHELIESELFGHEKGSFTGAHERRTGHFESANGGTLFLDEIGDMPQDAQAKVLRALETHEISRVGKSESIPVDIRVVAATNADLAAAVEEKTFRMDLFYRLNVVPLALPSLRERLEDVPALCDRFLARIAERSGRAQVELAPEALALLKTLDYPGNVRQLKNLLEGACVFAREGTIEKADLEGILEAGPGLSAAPPGRVAGGVDPFSAPTFEEFKNVSEKLFFQLKLDENEG
ncbi:MAG: sigma-54 dependent transcriptional regulator, partial [Planctomycetota bacterium]